MNSLSRRLFPDFDRWLDVWAPFTTSGMAEGFMPRADVKDKEGHFEISLELPGVKKDDVRVTLENGVLTIEAESKQEDKEEKEGRVVRQERRYGKYLRSFDLGGDVKESDIAARFQDGVLIIEAKIGQQKKLESKKIAIK